jgi:hypothetical protein
MRGARHGAFVCAALLCSALAAPAARADLSLLASPAELNVELRPGQSTAQIVKVINKGTVPFKYNAYSWEWWYSDKARKLFAPIGTFDRQAARWITISPAVMELKPGATAEVKVTVSAPADARGGYFAVVFFEVTPPLPPGLTEEMKARMGMGARLGVLVEVRATPEKAKGGASDGVASKVEMTGVEVEPPTAAAPLRLKVNAINAGPMMERPSGVVSLVEKATRRIRGKLDLTAVRMLPGQDGVFEGAFTGRLPPGEHEAIVTLTYGTGGTAVSRVPFTVTQ